MIQLTQTEVRTAPGAIDQLRAEFNETGCALLPGFLTTSVLQPLIRQIEAAHFFAKDEVDPRKGVFGATLFMPGSEPALFALHFLINRPTLFETVQRIAGCASLSNFLGRIH